MAVAHNYTGWAHDNGTMMPGYIVATGGSRQLKLDSELNYNFKSHPYSLACASSAPCPKFSHQKTGLPTMKQVSEHINTQSTF